MISISDELSNNPVYVYIYTYTFINHKEKSFFIGAVKQEWNNYKGANKFVYTLYTQNLW